MVEEPPDSGWHTAGEWLPKELVDPPHAIPALLSRIIACARHRFPGNLQKLINVIADNAFSWGHYGLVGSAVAISPSLSRQIKVALFKRIFRDWGELGNVHDIILFAMGLFTALSENPPSDEVTRRILTAVRENTREIIVGALFKEATYPAKRTWQPCLALRSDDIDLVSLANALLSSEYNPPETVPSNARLDDFARFVSQLGFQADEIKAAVPHLVYEMALSGR